MNDPMKALREAKLDAAESILNRLEGWDKAYPLEMFPEPTKAEREWLHENKRGLMDRIAASMGRHMAKCIREDIAALKAALAALGGEQEIVCSVCEHLCERIGNGYVPRGNSGMSDAEKAADRECAEVDAERFGTGFLVNGCYTHPSLVEVITPPPPGGKVGG